MIPHSHQNLSCLKSGVGLFIDNDTAEEFLTPLLRQLKFQCECSIRESLRSAQSRQDIRGFTPSPFSNADLPQRYVISSLFYFTALRYFCPSIQFSSVVDQMTGNLLCTLLLQFSSAYC